MSTSVTRDLVVDLGEAILALVLLTELVQLSMIEHLQKLLLSLVGGSVESLETLNVANELLNSAVRLVSIEASNMGNTVGANVDEHLLTRRSLVNKTANRSLGDEARADPQRIDGPLLVEDINGLRELGDGNEHILIDVVVLVLLVDLLSSEELEEGNLGRDQPTESVAEQGMVTKSQNVGNLPEERLGVTVEVVGGGDVLVINGVLLTLLLSLTEERGDVLVEPGLVKVTESVNLTSSRGLINTNTSHNNSSILGVDKSLNVLNVGILDVLLDEVDPLLLGEAGLILEVDELTGGNNLDIGRDQEAKSTVRPGDIVEKLGILILGATNELTRGKDDLEGLADVLEETVLERGALNTETSNETTNSQIVKLRDNGSLPTERSQGVSELTARNERLATNDTSFLIDLKDISEVVQVNLQHGILVLGVEDGGGEPRGTSSAHLLTGLTTTELILNTLNTLSMLLGRSAHHPDITIADVGVPLEELREGQHKEEHRDPTIL